MSIVSTVWAWPLAVGGAWCWWTNKEREGDRVVGGSFVRLDIWSNFMCQRPIRSGSESVGKLSRRSQPNEITILETNLDASSICVSGWSQILLVSWNFTLLFTFCQFIRTNKAIFCLCDATCFTYIIYIFLGSGCSCQYFIQAELTVLLPFIIAYILFSHFLITLYFYLSKNYIYTYSEMKEHVISAYSMSFKINVK